MPTSRFPPGSTTRRCTTTAATRPGRASRSRYGDFVGLDDLMTEHPTVVDGFVDVYQDWIDLGIDGFRIDTAKHVNFEFWEKWSTEVLDYARTTADKPDFFMFGEVYDADPAKLSPYVRDTDMNSVLDFTFQSNATVATPKGGSAEGAAGAVRRRRLLHDARLVGDGAADLPRQPRHGPHRLLPRRRRRAPARRARARADVPHARPARRLLRRRAGLRRHGGDKDARQSLFATPDRRVREPAARHGRDSWAARTASTRRRRSTSTSPTSPRCAQAHPALETGAQIERYVDDGAGVYAFSRVDRDEKVEYLVATNNTTTEQDRLDHDADGGCRLRAALRRGSRASPPTPTASHRVTVPALSAVVYTADETVTAPAEAQATSR